MSEVTSTTSSNKTTRWWWAMLSTNFAYVAFEQGKPQRDWAGRLCLRLSFSSRTRGARKPPPPCVSREFLRKRKPHCRLVGALGPSGIAKVYCIVLYPLRYIFTCFKSSCPTRNIAPTFGLARLGPVKQFESQELQQNSNWIFIFLSLD